MARTQGRARLIITGIVLVLVVLAVCGIVLAKRGETPAEPALMPTETKQADATGATKPAPSSDEDEVVLADPETLSTVDIEPLGVTVSYTKGIQGFSYEVKRTTKSTQYVEFSAEELTGTKCTNDQGLFATIIKDPSTTDEATLAQTTKVADVSYGLSLAGKGCTVDAALLEQYQTAFSEGFSSLKAL